MEYNLPYFSLKLGDKENKRKTLGCMFKIRCWIDLLYTSKNAVLYPILTQCYLLFISEYLRSSTFSLEIIGRSWRKKKWFSAWIKPKFNS